MALFRVPLADAIGDTAVSESRHGGKHTGFRAAPKSVGTENAHQRVVGADAGIVKREEFALFCLREGLEADFYFLQDGGHRQVGRYCEEGPLADDAAAPGYVKARHDT